ncbi:hypothetical protein BSKO_09334 [Bryopsis sp. KO-2023]|nr:hypothetical protein BSKO_09334 [Bryopsis sp. KO-2023]
MTACPKLNQLDMSSCKALEYVLLQSQSLTELDLSNCKNLKKALIHCPKLQKLTMTDCETLETLMMWSDEMTKLDLTGASSIRELELHCPALIDTNIPSLKAADRPSRPSHPPISHMLRDGYKLEARRELEEKENEQKIEGDSGIPKVFRPLT